MPVATTTARLARRARPALQQGVKQLAAAADRVRPPAPGVVVLAYHRVGASTSSEVDLPAAVFADQLAWLVEHARVVTLDDAVELLAGRGPAPDGDVVVVTFDDGTADFVDVAVPLLVEHGVPATLYLATEHVEQGRSFWDDGTVLSWAALADALATGVVAVGSHTHRHVLLDRSTPADVAADLDRSVDLIGERLGVGARHFAYPKALLASPMVELEVRRRFTTAALAGTRPNPYGATDLHRLARSPVQRSDGMGWFTAKARGGLGLEADLRRVVGAIRYRGAQR